MSPRAWLQLQKVALQYLQLHQSVPKKQTESVLHYIEMLYFQWIQKIILLRPDKYLLYPTLITFFVIISFYLCSRREHSELFDLTSRAEMCHNNRHGDRNVPITLTNLPGLKAQKNKPMNWVKAMDRSNLRSVKVYKHCGTCPWNAVQKCVHIHTYINEHLLLILLSPKGLWCGKKDENSRDRQFST